MLNFLKKNSLTQEQIYCLTSFFSKKVLCEFAASKYSQQARKFVLESNLSKHIPPDIRFDEFYDEIYTYLFTHYRYEYIYKNVLTLKLLLGKYSLNTANIHTEFRTGKCKADILLVNGTSHAFEIKSKLDNYDRLLTQISSYKTTFDFVNVITTQEQVKKLETLLSDEIGILYISNRNQISTHRSAKSQKLNVKPEIIFDSLRKNEYTNIIQRIFGEIPEVPNTKHYNVYKNYFTKLSPEIAHDAMIESLKARKHKDLSIDFINQTPKSLKAAIIFSRFNQLQQNNFLDVLKSDVSEHIH